MFYKMPPSKSVAIDEALHFGWQELYKNLVTWVSLAAFVGIVTLTAQSVTWLTNKMGWIEVATSIVVTLVSLYVSLGFANVALKAVRGQGSHWKYFWVGGRVYLKYVGASILYGLLALALALGAAVFAIALWFAFFDGADWSQTFNVGLMFGGFFGLLALLVVAVLGWRLYIRYHLYTYTLLDQSVGPVQALMRTDALTAGGDFGLFGYVVASGILTIGGFLFFGVGILVTLPVTTLGLAHVYRQLADQKPKA